MLIEKVEDFRFNGKSAIAAYLDGRQVWFKKYPVDAAFLGAGVLSAPVTPKSLVSSDISGDGALSAPVTARYIRSALLSGVGALSAGVIRQFQRAAPLSGGGTLSATVEIKNIISTASAPTNASRTVILTFPDYTDVKANDLIMLWPSTIAASSALTTPAGWTNVRGGNSTSTTTGVTMGYLYHFVTPAEESAGQNTFTLTNLWNVAQTGAVVGIVARYVSTQIPVDSNTVTPVGAPVTNHQLGAFAAAATRFSNSLIIGSVAAGAPTTYGPPSTGWTKLLESNTNAGRYLARRNALTTAGASSNVNICTAGTATVYTGVDLLLVQNFDGTLVQPAFGGGGTLSATAVEPVWTPALIPNLAYWIDPAQDLALGRFTDGQTITSYTSHGTGLVLAAYAGTPLGPKFRSSSVGGKPRLEFFPANQDGLVTTSYNPGTTGLTFVWVGQSAVADNYGMHLVYASNAGHSYELRNEAGSLGVQVIGDYQSGGPALGAAFTRSANTDYALMVNVATAGPTLKLFINDVLKINAAAVASMPNVASDLRVGHRVDGYFWQGLLAEAIVVSGPVSDTDRAKLMTYLRAKSYGSDESMIATTSTSPNTAHPFYTVGTRFKALVGGRITAIRFYRLDTSTATARPVHLWSEAGTLLATANSTLAIESGGGWKTVPLATPVSVTAGQTLTTSYGTPPNTGFVYAVGSPTSISPNLQVLGPQYALTQDTFPNTASGNHYFADVVFQAGGLAPV